MGKRKERHSTSGGRPLESNPFGALSSDGLKPAVPLSRSKANRLSTEKKKSRGRVDVKREKSGRGGKTVTVIYGMQHIERREREQLLKQIKTTSGVGGTMKDATMEIQGDNREAVQRILEAAGFQVVFAGG